jgi:hypothetical protein
MIAESNEYSQNDIQEVQLKIREKKSLKKV